MRILLVENNAGDANLFTECSSSIEGVSLRWVQSVEAALEYLHGNGGAQQEPLPDLIVTDLSLRRAEGGTGIDLIKNVQRDQQLREIPIAVLTGSPGGEPDCELLGVTRYFRKPMNIAGWRSVVRQLATLPKKQ
jgi:CheY-like chemotaxis protein